MFTSLLKAVSVVVDVPVAVVRDVVTLGGELSEKGPEGASYTTDAMSRFVENVENVANPERK